MLEGVETGKYKETEIDKIDDYFFSINEPGTFSGKDNEEVKFDKKFEEVNYILGKHSGKNPKKMTVLEYNTALIELKKEVKLRSKK